MVQRLLKLPKKQSFFLFGPRGTGKFTLLRSHFADGQPLWIDLLNQRLDFELSQDPDRLLDLWRVNKPKWVVIDEIQKNARLLDVVHRGIEEHRIKFALTGSSARKIKRSGANLLGGRAVERSLFPFSAGELGETFDLDRALTHGLLPRLWSEDLTPREREDYLYAYVQTYLREEVAAEQLVRDLDPFRRFLVSAAQMNGQIVNFAALERAAGIQARQGQRHFEILADTLIGSYLEPFHASVRARQTARSKFYFFDTGVVRALQGVAQEHVRPSTYEYGALFETFIINECLKRRAALGLRWTFSYLRTKDDVEVDLIIEKPRARPTLIEIKSASRFDETHLASLRRIKPDLAHSACYVLHGGELEREVDGIRYLPWRAGLDEIFSV